MPTSRSKKQTAKARKSMRSERRAARIFQAFDAAESNWYKNFGLRVRWTA